VSPAGAAAAAGALEIVAGQAVARDVAALRAFVAARRRGDPGGEIALVPTMGALHAGHLRLCALAREQARTVIVSVFVNPRQFAPHEDFARYPRALAADCAATAAAGVDLVFAPSVDELYPPGFQTRVELPALSAPLCGRSRPHFFGGVALVVLKLLGATQPDLAVFGEKDWQQLQVVRQLVADLHLPVRVVGAPLVRDADGLALSSRNAYLDAETRRRALALPRALAAAAAAVRGGARAAAPLLAEARAAIAAAGAAVDYVEIVDPERLTPLAELTGPARMVAAAVFGGTRLIDNVALEPPA
jgi:pantoate--beta-alanine ligase